MTYNNIILEHHDAVALITLNRPKMLNALCHELMEELAECITGLDQNNDTRVIVITGNEKAFAAGADIAEMSAMSFMDVYKKNFMVTTAKTITECRKPVIAAVSGYALGGGCELALLCDFILASDSAQFGQPEIKIGTIPGIGGSQRLTRAVGKAKAMEMILTGRMIDATEAERAGVAARIIPSENFLEDVLKSAAEMAEKSMPALMMAKEVVNAAFETPLSEGLRLESRLFQATFSTHDQKEGMKAFLEKRNPDFKDC